MGQEISASHFKKADFDCFDRHLRDETETLGQWFDNDQLSHRHAIGGFELEAWLVNAQGRPVAENVRFLERINDELVTPELSLFNIELNSTPLPVSDDALSQMHQELVKNWTRCRAVAAGLEADVMMIGTLPTLADDQLTLDNMSRMARYKALNEQVLRSRQGRPLKLDIQGRDHLQTEHGNVMLESATTSFQIHLQVTREKAARYYNAAQVLSAPLVAVAANSPWLFGRQLWQETRIPLFEQSVNVGGFEAADRGPVKRVTFGSGYVRESMMELFWENLEHYPILLPESFEEAAELLPHLRLQNGTIWRWNRPLVGFDDDGTPHLRIEHRVIPAGPSAVDAIANTAFFYGLLFALVAGEEVSIRFPYAQARDNFYRAARYGLETKIGWFDQSPRSIGELILQRLLPMAREGLLEAGCDSYDVARYLSIIEERTRRGQNGASWQIAWCERHGEDFAGLVRRYQHYQNLDRPVHTWPLDE